MLQYLQGTKYVHFQRIEASRCSTSISRSLTGTPSIQQRPHLHCDNAVCVPRSSRSLHVFGSRPDLCHHTTSRDCTVSVHVSSSLSRRHSRASHSHRTLTRGQRRPSTRQVFHASGAGHESRAIGNLPGDGRERDAPIAQKAPDLDVDVSPWIPFERLGAARAYSHKPGLGPLHRERLQSPCRPPAQHTPWCPGPRAPAVPPPCAAPCQSHAWARSQCPSHLARATAGWPVALASARCRVHKHPSR